LVGVDCRRGSAAIKLLVFLMNSIITKVRTEKNTHTSFEHVAMLKASDEGTPVRVTTSPDARSVSDADSPLHCPNGRGLRWELAGGPMGERRILFHDRSWYLGGTPPRADTFPHLPAYLQGSYGSAVG
jgi:hypothetical protein